MHRFISCGMACKGWLKNNLFAGIALRLVEARCRLRFAEDIRHAVVADTIAGSEIGMRVVVKCAPPDASRAYCGSDAS